MTSTPAPTITEALARLDLFEARAEAASYTDTDEAWQVFGVLRAALEREARTLPTADDAAAIQTARNRYACDDIEIDDTPRVSRVDPTTQADPGTWVSAWVWVAGQEVTA